ncbi:MAG: hypothetical protein WCE61_10150 [Candidatus Acidiferrum sp.]
MAPLLSKKVHKYQLVSNNFAEALTKFASDFQIPMGIEWTDNRNAQAKLNLSWKDSTVLNILRAIVATQPTYRIDLRPRIIRIWSAALVPERENPLTIVLDRFEVSNVPVEAASRRLHDLMRSKLKTKNFSLRGNEKPGGKIGSLLTNPDEAKVTVDLHRSSVEECLDALVDVSSRKIWIVTFSANTEVAATHFRRTLTLWNNFPIPDDEQPVWDLLHWGDAIPTAVVVKE